MHLSYTCYASYCSDCFGLKGKPLLASVNSYHNVSAVIDAIVEMGEAGVEIGASCLASGKVLIFMPSDT